LARKKNTRRPKGKLNDNPVKKFRREAFGAKNLKVGISRARENLSADKIPQVIEALSQNHAFFHFFCENTFPTNLSDLSNRKRFSLLDAEREFLWIASILAIFPEKISSFVILRDSFEENFLNSDWDTCSNILDEVEENLGVSLWLISRRVQLLHLIGGVRAQKDYIENVVGTENISSVVAYFTWYCGLKCEDAVSLEFLEDELRELLQPEMIIRDYVLYQVLPYHLTEINEEHHPIWWEETLPIVDRYLSFLWMAELSISKAKPGARSYISRSLNLVDKINDYRLTNLRGILGINEIPLSSGQFHGFDYYTNGSYESINFDSEEMIELKARTDFFLTGPKNQSRNLKDEISDKMGEMLVVSGSYSQSKYRLKKIAMMCFQMPVMTKIVAFIERSAESTIDSTFVEMDYLSAVQCSHNPWSVKAISQLDDCTNYLEKMKILHPESSSLGLQQALNVDYNTGLEILQELSLPPYRDEMYRGHISFKNGNLAVAAECYRSGLNSKNPYVQSRSNFFLFKALFSQKLYQECANLVVSHYLIVPAVVDVYPVHNIISRGLKELMKNPNMSLAILLSLSARYVKPKWERDLSDVYESILYDLGSEIPSETDFETSGFEKEEIVYFLRYICVQRIMDDTTAFDDPEEIELERVKICSKLVALDPENRAIYSSEIKSIIRDITIDGLLDKVYASKMYVDEDGILSAADERMRECYSRFSELSEQPDLNYQAGNISKLVENALGESKTYDFKDIKIPNSERGGLFTKTIEYFINQFAFNPAYGLDVNISSSVRHGAFEGHLRSSFSTRGLLCTYDSKNKTHLLPHAWNQLSTTLSEKENTHLLKCMVRFTEIIEDNVSLYLGSFLRVQSTDDPDGLFTFRSSSEELFVLMNSFETIIPYEEFIDRLLDFTWGLVDKSMEDIRTKLFTELRADINSAIDKLLSSIERVIPHKKLDILSDSITNSKTEFNALIVTISGWFQRSNNAYVEPFNLEVAINVALRQIQSCYADKQIEISAKISDDIKIAGHYLTGTVEIFFILLQNIALHGGSTGGKSNVFIEVTHEGKNLTIKTSNDLDPSEVIENISRIAITSVNNFNDDTAMGKVRSEGGSGLSKVWRILEYDYKTTHSLILNVKDNYTFETILKFNYQNIVEC